MLSSGIAAALTLPPGACIFLQHKGRELCEEMRQYKSRERKRADNKTQRSKRAIGTEEEAEGLGGPCVANSEHKPTHLS